MVFNSICGCAAGGARPAIAMSLGHDKKPQRMATVFAGQDAEATEHLRNKFPELPPSSPSIIITKDGELFEYIPRHKIEGRSPQEIAADLVAVYDNLDSAEAAE